MRLLLDTHIALWAISDSKRLSEDVRALLENEDNAVYYSNTVQDAAEVDPNLLRMLDRGLEDIEAGRTLPHDEAMAEVRRIREARRFARTDTGAAINA